MFNFNYSKLFQLLFILSFTDIISSHDFNCKHKGDEYGHQLLDVEEIGFGGAQGRMLANVTNTTNTTNATYSNFRIMTDVSLLSVNASDEYVDYIQNMLLPPIVDYLQSALKVKYPLGKPMKIPLSSLCGLDTPDDLMNVGVDTDFYIMYTAQASPDSWAASTSQCYLAAGSKRPLFATTTINTNLLVIASDDPLDHERNFYLLLHELIHGLGFSSSMFKYFIDSNGNPLTNQFAYKVINGQNRTFINVAPLTAKLRTFYGCSTLPGALIEQDGEGGTAGSHFERKNFLYEVLTSGIVPGRRISQFSLAMLEGSGWYVANYSFAEPFFAGQGQGCNYTYGTCPVNGTQPFDEFCGTTNARGCSALGRGGAKCQVDSKSDGCKYYYPFKEYDCLNPNAASYTRLATIQSFGQNAGSKCFDGTLSTKINDTSNSFCFQYNCKGTGLKTYIEVTIASTIVNCTAEGTATVAGYKGYINCPDPLQFCNTVGLKYCPRNCLGRGKCVNGACVCNSGFTGVDCGYAL